MSGVAGVWACVPAAQVGLCFAKPLWLATTARAGPAGRPLPSRRPGRLRAAPCARHYRRDGRGLPAAPAAVSWWGWVKDCSAIAKAIESYIHGARIDRARHLCSASVCPTGCKHSPATPVHDVVAPKTRETEARVFSVPRRTLEQPSRMSTPRRASRLAAETEGAISGRAVAV